MRHPPKVEQTAVATQMPLIEVQAARPMKTRAWANSANTFQRGSGLV